MLLLCLCNVVVGLCCCAVCCCLFTFRVLALRICCVSKWFFFVLLSCFVLLKVRVLCFGVCYAGALLLFCLCVGVRCAFFVACVYVCCDFVHLFLGL